MKVDLKRIGMRVRKKRLKMGWSQEDLAYKSGFSSQHISNIERGHKKLSIQSLIYISDALGSSLDELLCDSIKKSSAYIRDDISALLDNATENQIKVVAQTIAALLAEWNRVGSDR